MPAEQPPALRAGRLAATLIFGFMLIVPTMPNAQEQCANATLKGRYVLCVNRQRAYRAPRPRVSSAYTPAHSCLTGSAISPGQSSSRGGKIGRREAVSSTYTVDSDCTGMVTFRAQLATTVGGAIHRDPFIAKVGQRDT